MADEQKAVPEPGVAGPAGESKDKPSEPSPAGKIGSQALIFLLITAAVYAGTVFASWAVAERVVVPKLSSWLAVREALHLAEEASARELPPFGEIYLIEDLVVNPAGSGGMRYLCASVGLESRHPAVIQELTVRDTQIKDCLILIFSSKTIEELADIGARETIRQEIKTRIEEILPEHGLDAVYFVNFVLQ